MVNLELEVDRLAADLAVFNIACRARTCVNGRFEVLAAIRTLDHVKPQAAWILTNVTLCVDVDDGLKAVLRINVLGIG